MIQIPDHKGTGGEENMPMKKMKKLIRLFLAVFGMGTDCIKEVKG